MTFLYAPHNIIVIVNLIVNHFFVDGADSLILDYAYSGWLVALSFLVATCGSALAIELRSHSRSGDVAARFGGEEFVVLLPNATAPQTEAVANRLREDFAKLLIHTESGQHIAFTVSVGVTTSNGRDHLTPEKLIAEADAALYEVKNTGRNGVVVWRESNT